MPTPIYSITPFTLLDYPDHTACIIWFAGCNMRCNYCYNPDIVLGKGKLSVTDALHFLRSRQSLLQAVVFSGGECTIHPSLPRLAKEAKKMGFMIKVDTNGANPKALQKLLDDELVDYVALDFKAPYKKYNQITKIAGFESFASCLDILQTSSISYEVRTTWHGDLLSLEDLDSMTLFLAQRQYTGKYYIQRFRNDVETLGAVQPNYTDLKVADLASSGIDIVLRNF